MTQEPELEDVETGLQELIFTVEQVVLMFESALEILQAAQRTIPAPALEDIA